MEILQISRTTLRNLRKEGENSPRLIENLKLIVYKVSPESLIGIRSSSSILSRVDSSDYQMCIFCI